MLLKTKDQLKLLIISRQVIQTVHLDITALCEGLYSIPDSRIRNGRCLSRACLVTCFKIVF